jgi:hypothetical protein
MEARKRWERGVGPRAGGWGMPPVVKFHRCVPVDECTAYTLKSKL